MGSRAVLANVSDFTQNAQSTRAQTIGQSASIVIGYALFAFSSVSILVGGSIILASVSGVF